MTPTTPWRLIIHPAGRGAWNMAVDEAILESAGRRLTPPTLRLYAWSPPCLSLGFTQPAADVDQEGLNRRGWDLVRRPTGGRAILHTDELTYSLAAPLDEPHVYGSVLQSYSRLSQGLIQMLTLVGIRAHADQGSLPDGALAHPGPVCFQVPSKYEITVNEKKLIGSAQARRKDGVLQHGSIPLCGDLTRINQALAYPSLDARRQADQDLRAHATHLEAVLGRRVPWEELSQACARGFAQALQLHLVPGQLTPGEVQRAHELQHEKYDHASWTLKS
ncbi:MAG: lipoate--protein ligase family protein [Chloroflexi bacterium]|nr:lipoate--protein ligase family protein [Chloroflexota bacterium]